MATIPTRSDTTDTPTARTVSEIVRSELTTCLAEDGVLLRSGVTTQAMGEATSTARYRLHLDWRAPHVGTEITMQPLDLSMRYPDGSVCPDETTGPLLSRALAVLRERITRRDLPVVELAVPQIRPGPGAFYLLYRHLPAGQADSVA